MAGGRLVVAIVRNASEL